MDHDVKSLQAFMEARFNSLDRRQDDCLQLIATTNEDTASKLSEVKDAVDATNGRLRKAEVVIAVLRFAVFTIGGGLLVGLVQFVVSRMSTQ